MKKEDVFIIMRRILIFFRWFFQGCKCHYRKRRPLELYRDWIKDTSCMYHWMKTKYTYLDFSNYAAIMSSDLMTNLIEEKPVTGVKSIHFCVNCQKPILLDEPATIIGKGTFEDPYRRLHFNCIPVVIE